MKRILIVGLDEELSQTLSQAIRERGDFSITRATTVREACLLLSQQRHALALAPLSSAPNARHALQALQPDLAFAAIDTGASERLQGTREALSFDLISMDRLAEDLEGLLETREDEGSDLADEPAFDKEPPAHTEKAPVTPSPAHAPASPAAGTSSNSAIRAVLHGVTRESKVVGTILSSDAQVREFGGTLSREQVQAIARRVSETWHEHNSALLQFLKPPEQASDLLLYTRPTLPSHLLTLAATPDLNVGRLRRAADALAADLAQMAGDEPASPAPQAPARQTNVADTHGSHTEKGGKSFALLFQPRRPFPAALQEAVRKALDEVAEAAGCSLSYRQVEADIVHLVTTCPNAQGSGWLAHLYKHGVEERIQEQFGVPAHLWRRGFYATQSERPLNEIELKLFALQGN